MTNPDTSNNVIINNNENSTNIDSKLNFTNNDIDQNNN